MRSHFDLDQLIEHIRVRKILAVYLIQLIFVCASIRQEQILVCIFCSIRTGTQFMKSNPKIIGAIKQQLLRLLCICSY